MVLCRGEYMPLCPRQSRRTPAGELRPKRHGDAFAVRGRILGSLRIVCSYNFPMRAAGSIIGIVVTLALGMGLYVMYMRGLPGGKPGATPVSLESSTSARMQLLNIAQAERTY